MGILSKIIFTVVIASIILCGYALYEEEMEWQSYSVAHNCKVTGIVAPKTVVAYGRDSTTSFVTIPGSMTYQCDDGITVTR